MSAQWETVYNNLRQKTVPGLLCERARSAPNQVAYQTKKLGVYKKQSWFEFACLVSKVAKAFESVGLRPGDRVAIMGDPCEEWVVADIAAQAIGCITYGIYPTASLEEVEYQMIDGGAVLFVAEDQEYVDKILALSDQLKVLRHILVIDATALFAYQDDRLLTFSKLISKHSASLDWLEQKLSLIHI